MTLLPWFGGKVKHADWIGSFIPPHRTYVEPFGGAMAVLLAKEPSPVEVYNDVDEALVHFWRVVRDPRLYRRLRERLELTPYARGEWDWSRRAWRDVDDPVERAARWWIGVRQSFAANAPGSGSAGWSFSVDGSARGMSREVSKYLSAIVGLPAVHARLRRVQIEHGDWRRIFDLYDGPATFFYCDPPYVPETRRRGGYVHELTSADHAELVARLTAIEGGAVLSGYEHEVHRPLEAAGWTVRRRRVQCHAAWTRRGGRVGQVRTECLWLSPSVIAAAERPALAL